jgi:acyl-coenzyme A thioesterase PaaI-like protein
MKKEIRTVKTKKGVKDYTYLGCPLTRNRSAWCYRLCTPDDEGHGRCGRVAPHSIKSRIQLAIEKHNKKLQKIHIEKLENMYLATAGGNGCNPGIKITEGSAEILTAIGKKRDDKEGEIDSSFLFKAMTEASLYAVNSMIADTLLKMVNFNTYLIRTVQKGELITKGRFVGTCGDQFLAEAVITDADGNEIARGNGSFMKSDIPLSSVSEYK